MSDYGANTVYEAFVATAARRPDSGMLAAPPAAKRDYHPDGVELTYGEIAAEVERYRALYAAAGYGPGHRVALLLEQRPEFFHHYLALNGLGASIVPVNPDYRHDELAFLMEHSEADLAVTLDKYRDRLDNVAAERVKPLPVVSFEDPPETFPAPTAVAGSHEPGIGDECTLLYTSGTTGRPKGCILTNEYFLNGGRWYLGMEGLAAVAEEGDRLYNPLPFFHMNCLALSATAMIQSGGCLILPDRFHPRSWWQDLVATRATIAHYLGVVVPMLLNQPECAEEKAHQVRFLIGAGCEPTLHEVFETRFGAPLIEVWGMTETGRIYYNAQEPRQIDTRAFGRPFGGFEARVVDDEDSDVPLGDEGELVVRFAGPDPRRAFFAGYLKNAEETEKVWRGGWFHTGDTVRQDDTGMLYFVDRKKNIIRRSGENIAAAEIEAVLQSHDAVGQVAVIPTPDRVREEEVMACIVPMAGAEAGETLAADLFDWCYERLTYFKAPGWVVFRDSLPTTGTQKIQKAQIFAADEDPQQVGFDFRERKKRR